MNKSVLSFALLLIGVGLFAAFTPTPMTAQSDSLPAIEGAASEWISVGSWEQQSFVRNSADSITAPLTTASIQLFLGGSCPGIKQASVFGATPGGLLQFVYGLPGTYIVPSGPCTGLVLDLATPTLGPSVTADATGSFSGIYFIPLALCNFSVQAIDVFTCTASNVEVL